MAKFNNLDALLQEGLAVLRTYGLEAEIERTATRLGAREVDAIVRLERAAEQTLLIAELKPHLNRANVAQAIERGKDGQVILITRYAPTALAELLRANRVPYVDLAGNAWLQMPNFVLWVEGRKPMGEAVPPGAAVAAAFNPGGLQVIFALLVEPTWAALTTRQLAEKVQLANGTVAAALRALEAQGFITRATPRAKRRLRNTRVLLDKWTEGYLQRFQNRQLLAVYRAERAATDWWKHVDPARHLAVLGGEPAAAELTGFLIPGEITLYAQKTPALLIADNKLVRDPAGTILLRRKFWHFEAPEWNNDRFAPAPLIYADLMGTGDARCIETAAKIRDRYLARLLFD